MTTLSRTRAGTGNGGVPARRAVFRWGWRLFRREWRQQLLVLSLLTVAVAATIWGTSVVTNWQLASPGYATYGTAAAQVTLPGTDPHLAADIATIAGRWGPADVIENQDIPTGTAQSVQLRAENSRGHYNSPLLSLVSGTYPAGPGQVALTSQVATLDHTHAGGTWQAAGHDLAGDRHRARPEQPGGRVRAGRPRPGPAPQPGDYAAGLLPSRPAGDQQRQRNAARYASGGDVHVPFGFHQRAPAGDGRPGGRGTRPGVHRPGVGRRFLGDGPAQAACPRHAERDRRDRTQPPPGHDRGRPGRRRGRCACRSGAWLRRLVRLRADAAAGCRPRGRRGEPAVVGVRHRGRVRDRDVGAGLPPPG